MHAPHQILTALERNRFDLVHVLPLTLGPLPFVWHGFVLGLQVVHLEYLFAWKRAPYVPKLLKAWLFLLGTEVDDPLLLLPLHLSPANTRKLLLCVVELIAIVTKHRTDDVKERVGADVDGMASY